MNIYFLAFVLICGLALQAHPALQICRPGTCSLDSADEDGNTEHCNIPADTECSDRQYCNDHGTCFMSRKGTVYCKCSDDYFGDKCELLYSYLTLDDCNSNSSMCQNGGTCELNKDQRWHCACTSGYRGGRCEQTTRNLLLTANTCRNGGTRYVQGSQTGCLCPCGFAGDFCEKIQYSAVWHWTCSQKMCNGKGVCNINSTTRVAHCVCRSGFGGEFCELVEPCKCLNGGSCILEWTGREIQKVCRCECGYTGDTCQTIDQTVQCSSDYCQSGGTCTLNHTSCLRACHCRAGYCGERCQQRNDACTSYSCQHGGLCHIDQHSCEPVCKCTEGYHGPHCEYSLSECPLINSGKSLCRLIYCPDGKTCVDDKCGLPECVTNDAIKHASATIVLLCFVLIFMVLKIQS